MYSFVFKEIPELEEAQSVISKYPTIEDFIEDRGFFTRTFNVVTKEIKNEDRLYYHLCKAVVNENLNDK